jgi:hypothetical protein
VCKVYNRIKQFEGDRERERGGPGRKQYPLLLPRPLFAEQRKKNKRRMQQATKEMQKKQKHRSIQTSVDSNS